MDDTNKGEIGFAVDEHFPHWCIGGPWYKRNKFHNLNEPVFEDLCCSLLQYRYELICGLHAYNRLHKKLSDKIIFGGGITLPEDSTIYFLVYMSFSNNFIDTWLKSLAYNFSLRCCAYQENMKELIRNNRTKNLTPTPEYFKKKGQHILTNIVGKCYVNKMCHPKPPTKNTLLKEKTK